MTSIVKARHYGAFAATWVEATVSPLPALVLVVDVGVFRGFRLRGIDPPGEAPARLIVDNIVIIIQFVTTYS